MAASPDIAWFLESGRRGASSVREGLRRSGREPEGLRALLDFGCGSGRVVRHWARLPGEVHGCDVNGRLVAWCCAHLPFGQFATTRLEPPLPYPDARFDFVYALSVFTHLPEPLQHAWMSELRRILEPGGLLLITTHGPHYAGELDAGERSAFEAGELVVRYGQEAGSNTCGAYHPPAWVRSRLAVGFDVVDYQAEGASGNPWQDLYVLRRI